MAEFHPEVGWLDEDRKTLPPLDVPDVHKNAYDTYREAADGLEARHEVQWAFENWYAGVGREGDTDHGWMRRARRVVKSNARALRGLHRGARQPYASPRGPAESVRGDTAPFQFLNLPKLGCVSALLLHAEGHDEQALSRAADLIAFGARMAPAGDYVELVNGRVVLAMAWVPEVLVVRSGRVEHRRLLTHADDIARLRPAVGRYSHVLRWMAAFMLTGLDAYLAGTPEQLAEDLSDEDRTVSPQFAAELLAHSANIRAWVEDRFVRLMDEAGKPPERSRFRSLVAQTERDLAERADPLSGVFVPTNCRAYDSWLTAVALLGGFESVARVEAYCLRNDSYPPSLEAAFHGSAEPVPLDPWDGKPMKYRTTEDGYILYCIGPDLDDDGGAVRAVCGGEGDLVIVPPPGPPTGEDD